MVNNGLLVKQKARRKKILWGLGIIGLFVAAWLLASGVSYVLGYLGKEANNSPFISFLAKKVTSQKSGPELKGESDGRVNILLLGMPGTNHQGPELTDTIIVLSIKPKENKAAMLSIPRDLYAKAPNTYSYAKINSIYVLGKQKAALKTSLTTEQVNAGYADIKQVAGEITGLPIHYYLKMDFAGFEKIIDELGGVDIYVEKDLYDPYYPTDNYGYQTLKISKGQEHMDGSLALKYARSRETSSDFDRAKRQQQIMTAVRDKAKSLSLCDAKKIVNLLKIIEEHFRTDMSYNEIARLGDIAKDIQKDKIVTRVLDNSAKSVLKSASYNGAYALIPKEGMGNYTAIHQIAENIFEEGYIISENAQIEVQNGTSKYGLASQQASLLENYGLAVVKIATSKTKYQKTQIIDYTNGAKPNTIKFLKSKYSGVVKKETMPKYSKSDIVIILGSDIISTKSQTIYQ